VLRHGALSIEVLRETCPGLVDQAAPEPDPSELDPSEPLAVTPESVELRPADPGRQKEAPDNPGTDDWPPPPAGA
jgi:hypothetical protein